MVKQEKGYTPDQLSGMEELGQLKQKLSARCTRKHLAGIEEWLDIF